MIDRITKLDSPTAQLPITINTFKQHARWDLDIEDPLIQLYMQAATEWAEEQTRRAIMQRNYLVVRDQFPTTIWSLPLGYVDSITSVKYLDSDGAEQTWASANYVIDNASNHEARLYPKPGFSFPTIGDYLSAARVTLVAGWSAVNVPYTIREALLLKTASFFDVRAPGDPDPMVLEDAALKLLQGWRLPPYR